MTNDLRDQLQKTLGQAITIDRELGGGGMSRVFVATDTALDRQIVVKMLPAEALPTASLERFHREIRTMAKLQHPHIVPVLSAGETGGLPFYTMPLVPGESLRHRLATGGELSVNEATHVLRDVASALAYAHRAGVVHRDIKPENVMLSGGVAVVTDFGVAKAVDVAATDSGHKERDLTSIGVALGTPAYMSPEQASADQHVDHRSDIYSFGCVAYEMLAGAGPFAGRTTQQMLAAHVQETPEPLLTRRPSVPPALAALVMRCLEKRSGDRPQSADELIAALDAIATPTATRPAATKPARRRMSAYAGAAVVGLSAIGTYLAMRTPPPVRLSQQSAVANGAELEIMPAISPDGKFVAYSSGVPGQYRIYVKQIGAGKATPLTGDLDGDHGHPSWSPDGTQIVFEAKQAAYVVPAFGGAIRKLFALDSDVVQNPTWSPDGKRIAYSDINGIWIRAADGGSPTLRLAGRPFHSVTWSRDGRLLAFVEGMVPTLMNKSPGTIWTMPSDVGERQRISESQHLNTSPAFLADGSVLYVSNRDGAPDVWQQALRADGRPRGEPVRLTTGLFAANISVSADGTKMVYDVVRNRSRIWSVMIPPSGVASITTAKQLTTENEHIEGLRLSHDGAWLAYDTDRNGNADIYKVKLDGGTPVQLTTNPGDDYSPAWSPDDREIVFHSARNGDRDVFVMSADGGAEQQVTSGSRQDYHPDWSPDGRRIVFGGAGAPGESLFTSERVGNGRWSEPRAIPGTRDAHPLLSTSARWSPDGTRLVSRTGPEGQEVGIRPAEGGTARVIRSAGAEGGQVGSFVWTRRPPAVFVSILSPDGRYSFWSIPESGGTPRLVLRDDPLHRLGRWDFDTDGKRLFFTLAADESDVWVAELKK